MTQKTKSPFLIVPEFVSPLMCEEMIDQLDFLAPDTNKKGTPIMSYKYNEDYESYLYDEFKKHIPAIEAHYEVEHDATSQTIFEWYPEGSEGRLHAENAEYIKQKWLRVRDRDLTAVVFLTDYNDQDDFDDLYEVYGGKLEFPQHKFGFNPQRGTMILYPSLPHFINTVTLVQAGDLHIARFHIKTKSIYLYDPSKFPGDYRTWFVDVV